MPEPATVTLLLSCADQPGIVAAVADFVYRHGGNIVHADQHIDDERGVFFQRVEVGLDGFRLDRDEIDPALDEIERRFGMDVQVRFSDERPRVAVLVSREPHCMYDLLARWRGGELDCDIALIVSNHPDHVEAAEHFGVPYVHLPVSASTRADQERALVEMLDANAVDLVVLARYMQILSPAVVARYPQRIINIHHSFCQRSSAAGRTTRPTRAAASSSSA